MIIVHIGLPKSGSATIQTFLDSHDEALRDLSIDYPRLGRLNRKAHHNFANELKGRGDRFNPVSGRVSDLPDYLRASGRQATVFSSESFAKCEGDAVERLGEVLASTGQPVRIIMIVRNLIDQAPSTYAQHIRHGHNTYDFDAFLERWRERDLFDPFTIANRWAGVFGWDAMRLRVLDSASLLNGDLLDDFLATMDLDPDAPALRALPRRTRVNESAGWMTLEAIRALFAGRAGLDRDHPLARLIDGDLPDHKAKRLGIAAEQVGGELGWNKDRGRYLTRAQAEQLHEAYATSLERINGCLTSKLAPPKDLDAHGFVERGFLPDATHMPADALRDFYEILTSRVVERSEPVGVDQKAQKKAEKMATRIAAKRAGKKAARLNSGTG